MCTSVCLARSNVYVPDELAERARARGLNISAVTQNAISAELEMATPTRIAARVIRLSGCLVSQQLVDHPELEIGRLGAAVAADQR